MAQPLLCWLFVQYGVSAPEACAWLRVGAGLPLSGPQPSSPSILWSPGIQVSLDSANKHDGGPRALGSPVTLKALLEEVIQSQNYSK